MSNCLLRAHEPNPGLATLQQEVLACSNVAALAAASPVDASAIAVDAPLRGPCVLNLPQGRLSMFTTLTTFGTLRDITLDALSIELFCPVDEASEALLRALHTV